MKSDFRQGRAGMVFKDGKLFEFTSRHVLVLSGWPDPRAWWKRRSHGWKATRKRANEFFASRVMPGLREMCHLRSSDLLPLDAPYDQYVLPDIPISYEHAQEMWMYKLSLLDHQASSAYFATLPAEVRKELGRYRDRPWYLFNLFARCPGALDLSRSNPALAFALANNWVFHKPAVARPVRAARSLVFRKQKVILDWLGFPATEPVRRILAKVDPDQLSVWLLLVLRKLLRRPDAVRSLSHLQVINTEVVRLLADPELEEYLSPVFLADASHLMCLPRHLNPEQLSAVSLLKDTLSMTLDLYGRANRKPFPSLARLQERHDDLAYRLNERSWMGHYTMMEKRYGDIFPAAPYLGTEAIRPIETVKALTEEGAGMRHCARTRAERVFHKQEFIYKVTDPVRATLSIVVGPRGWVPGEAFGPSNAKLPAAVWRKLFHDLFRSRRNPLANGLDEEEAAAMGRLPPELREERREDDDDPGPVVTRCELPEGMPLPLSWTYHNPMQMPLLPPEDLAVYKRCLQVFGGLRAKDPEPPPGMGNQKSRVA